MIKQLPRGKIIYCDHCGEYIGPFQHLKDVSDAAICAMLDNSHWRTGYGPSLSVATKRVQYCPDCKAIPACQMCATVAREGDRFCSDHCGREWRSAHA